MDEFSETPVVRLSSVRGQARALDRLARELRTDRVHHAHLFCGPEGVGKTRAARALAHRLLCAEPQGADACGRCRSCLKIASGNHPDLVWVSPDGASIKIAQARAVAGLTRYRPNEGRWRVIVIEQAEKMGEAAANALLKTIEEPGGQTLFVLVTSSQNMLLPTIRSRCVAVAFGPLPLDITADILRENGVEDARVDALSRVCRGAPGRAMRLDNSGLWDERNEVLRVLMRVAAGDVTVGLRFAADLSADRDRVALEARLEVWMSLIRDVLVLLSTKQPSMLQNQDVVGPIRTLADRLDVRRTFAWMAAVERAVARIHGNVQLRLITESLILELDENDAQEIAYHVT